MAGTSVAPSEQRRLLGGFVAPRSNCRYGALEALLAEDVVYYADGGGMCTQRRPLFWSQHVATFIALFPMVLEGLRLDWVETNEDNCFVLRDGVPFGLTIDASAQSIDE